MIIIPKEINECLKKLQDAGYEAFCVGGAVRDLYMGITPYDYDITTNASPDSVMSIFDRTVPTGIKHGTVTVLTENYSVEVTTYRADGDYKEHRHPEKVDFVNSIESDLCRRDFTVNAICYTPSKGIYDPLGGIKDIENKIIRAVGDPYKRFNEDALRVLRAFRFSAVLGFTIEQNTFKAALKSAGLLEFISPERIFCEIKKAVISDHLLNIAPLIDSGALKFCGIEHFNYTDAEKAPPCFPLRLAIMCNSPEKVKLLLKNLHSDNRTANDAYQFSLLLNEDITEEKYRLKLLLRKYGQEKLIAFLQYKSKCGHNTDKLSETLDRIVSSGEPYEINMLSINGNDLKCLGISGKEIGSTLEKLLDTVMHDPGLNRKDILSLLAEQK